MNWQPIETAPKDGTKIDVWLHIGHRACDVCWHVYGCWNRNLGPDWAVEEWHHDEKHWHDLDGIPTHWMPTPQGPMP